MKKKLKQKAPKILVNTSGLNMEKRNPRIIFSLTSFPERINIVSETIKTLLTQTIKPDLLVLWLAEEQFPQKENQLPKELLDLKQYGLTIKWCSNIRSYKKLIPALKEFPDDIIITFDDDIYYPKDTVEKLYNSYLQTPNCIHTNRARRLDLKNNQIISRSAAENFWIKYKEPSFFNKITGCGGVLYPPNSLDKRVFDEETFKEIIPTQDDIWFWTMAILKGTKIKLVAAYDIQLPTVEKSQEFGLSKINAKNNIGLGSLEAAVLVAEKYPEVITKLNEEISANS